MYFVQSRTAVDPKGDLYLAEVTVDKEPTIYGKVKLDPFGNFQTFDASYKKDFESGVRGCLSIRI